MEAFPCVLFHTIMVSLTSLVLWSLLAKPILSFLVPQFPGGNKVPPPGGRWGLNHRIYCLSTPETRSLSSRCERGGSFWRSLEILGAPWLVETPPGHCLHVHMPLSLWAYLSVQIPPFTRTLSYWIQIPPHCSGPSSAKTAFLTQVTS